MGHTHRNFSHRPKIPNQSNNMEIPLGKIFNKIESLPHPNIKNILVKHQIQIRKGFLQAPSADVFPQIHPPS